MFNSKLLNLCSLSYLFQVLTCASEGYITSFHIQVCFRMVMCCFWTNWMFKKLINYGRSGDYCVAERTRLIMTYELILSFMTLWNLKMHLRILESSQPIILKREVDRMLISRRTVTYNFISTQWGLIFWWHPWLPWARQVLTSLNISFSAISWYDPKLVHGFINNGTFSCYCKGQNR
jgi:hypothetical protein